MFETLLRRLSGPTPAPLPDPEAHLAMAALLVRVARADRRYGDAETSCIDDLLAHHYGLDAEAAAQLRARAETLETEAPDTVRFTRSLKAAVPLEERAWVIEALWAVVLADGHRDAEEDAKMRLLANLLGFADRDSALARQRVQQRG